MKKNLAKKITMSILAGAMLMSSSVVWAGSNITNSATGSGAIAIGGGSGYSPTANGSNAVAIGNNTQANGLNAVAIGNAAKADTNNSVAMAYEAEANGSNAVAIGLQAKANGSASVAIGDGAIADADDVVSVGNGGASGAGGPNYRRIINVADGVSSHDAVTFGQLKNNYYDKNQIDEKFSSLGGASSGTGSVDLSDYAKTADVANTYATKAETQTALDGKADKAETLAGYGITNAFTKDEVNNKLGDYAKTTDVANTYATKAETQTALDGKADKAETLAGYGITNAFTKDEVNNKLGDYAKTTDVANTYATKAETQTALDGKANKATTLEGYGIIDAYTKTEIDGMMLGGSSDAIAGINQRFDKTNAKINKVGAGAAALAALHPLDYDPDDKLTFSAGMGNYAGENAVALGAFYRPNEKFMVSLGGTMGNGENMVNLGLSIGLDKPNGFAKLSKRELIQKVNAVEAENDALEDRVAKLEALVAQLAKK